ncbi:phage tail protein [Chrysiogenes arsenatis]|uniref:phage tail protein n=1 Tax=Chrysiogenes arsenatis TaxID=309797 RepID=UPI0003F86CE1|nr:phage tail protein [Chrysiogenes arsenatis]
MIDTMMALGVFRFALDTAAYQQLVRSAQYRWGSQERLGRRPARQFLGQGEESVKLSGIIYPHFAGGVRQLERMRDLAGAGKPLLLVDGRGMVWGLWCIEQIEETRSEFLANGDPQKVEFVLSLGHYGEDV